MPVKEACDSGGPKGGTPYLRQTHQHGSILGAPLLLFKLRDTSLRGLGRGLGGPVGSILVSRFCSSN